MPTPYFAKFPVVLYDMKGDKVETVVRNIVHRARLKSLVKENAFLYHEYLVGDGETPEYIAHKYYGDTKYHWVVMYANDILNPHYDWVWSYDNLIAYMEKIYGDIPTAHQTVHHYEDEFRNVIDKFTFDELPDSERRQVSCYEYWMEWNEKKRSIKLIDKRYLQQMDGELDGLLDLES